MLFRCSRSIIQLWQNWRPHKCHGPSGVHGLSALSSHQSWAKRGNSLLNLITMISLPKKYYGKKIELSREKVDLNLLIFTNINLIFSYHSCLGYAAVTGTFLAMAPACSHKTTDSSWCLIRLWVRPMILARRMSAAKIGLSWSSSWQPETVAHTNAK